MSRSDDFTAYFDFPDDLNPLDIQPTFLNVQSIASGNMNHLPSPPSSSVQSPMEANVSVPRTFSHDTYLHASPPDIILMSSDNVLFYLNSVKLKAASQNGFNHVMDNFRPRTVGHAASPAILRVELPSDVLNIILHTVYEIPSQSFHPSFSTVSSAIDHMVVYGIHPKPYLSPSRPLASLILSLAPLHPIDTFVIAAHYDVEELAVTISSCLLSFPLSSITDELAAKVGPVYLRRLFFLHLGRIEALKRLLREAPYPHAPTRSCKFEDQRSIQSAWRLAASYIAWNAKPDISTAALRITLNPLGEKINCDQCRDAFNRRLNEVLLGWSLVKTTI